MWSFKENAKEITSWTYLFPVAQVASSAHQIGTGALIITSNYVLGILGPNFWNWFYMSIWFV